MGAERNAAATMETHKGFHVGVEIDGIDGTDACTLPAADTEVLSYNDAATFPL